MKKARRAGPIFLFLPELAKLLILLGIVGIFVGFLAFKRQK
jgi:hypothetical protein